MTRRVYKAFLQNHPLLKYGGIYEEEHGYVQEIQMIPKKDFPQILEKGPYVGAMIPFKDVSDGLMEINMSRSAHEGLGYNAAKVNRILLQ